MNELELFNLLSLSVDYQHINLSIDLYITLRQNPSYHHFQFVNSQEALLKSLCMYIGSCNIWVNADIPRQCIKVSNDKILLSYQKDGWSLPFPLRLATTKDQVERILKLKTFW
jgi:hypothetical protein